MAAFADKECHVKDGSHNGGGDESRWRRAEDGGTEAGSTEEVLLLGLRHWRPRRSRWMPARLEAI